MSEEPKNPFGRRPRSRDIKSSETPPSKPEVIRRIAQEGNVPFPRAIAYHSGLSLHEKFVALWLYDHLKPGTNIATGSQDLIAEDLGFFKEDSDKCSRSAFGKNISSRTQKNT